MWYEPARPFLPAEAVAPAAESRPAALLDITDVLGRRAVSTGLAGTVTIPEENAVAALEVMSRFAADPRWLVYLPPTMSPSETSRLDGWLEHPREALRHFRTEGVGHVVCEEKHMGSRAVVVLCRDEGVAARRFRISDAGSGAVLTRTGRRFFDDAVREAAVLARVGDSVTRAGLWDELHTDWMVVDAELMPWSAKAAELLRTQYAPLATAAGMALHDSVAALDAALPHNPDLAPLLDRYRRRAALVDDYREAYRRYCWEVESVDDLRLAAFHLLASEGAVHIDRDHMWHMATLARLSGHDPLLLATAHRLVDDTDVAAVDAAVDWWTELTERGGEGMVVKPLGFIARARRGLVQPAVKCRGREYLRIIYGPEYTLPEDLEVLRTRSLGRKRSLALREFALGIEALQRFVRGEPLHRVHECVFGVLALESEPVDPRL
jgi:protein phosphatase